MEEKYPTLLARIQSSLIDGILVIILMYITSMLLDNFPNIYDEIRVFLFVLIVVLFDPICVSLGCTLGNYMMGIRVRKAEDTSKKIDFFQALLRYPVKLILGSISFLTIHSNPKRRAIHDFASGSVMIEV